MACAYTIHAIHVETIQLVSFTGPRKFDSQWLRPRNLRHTVSVGHGKIPNQAVTEESPRHHSKTGRGQV